MDTPMMFEPSKLPKLNPVDCAREPATNFVSNQALLLQNEMLRPATMFGTCCHMLKVWEHGFTDAGFPVCRWIPACARQIVGISKNASTLATGASTSALAAGTSACRWVALD